MMRDSIPHDDTIDALSLLATHEPDRARAASVRACCHAALRKRQARQHSATPARWAAWRRALEPAIVGGLCAVYLFEVITRALTLYRF